MSSYGIDLQDHILQARQQDDRYMEIRHGLQHQGTGELDVDYHLKEVTWLDLGTGSMCQKTVRSRSLSCGNFMLIHI